MLSTNSIPARDLQKYYKSIIAGVATKKHPVVLTTHNKPQAAIVSLEDLQKIQHAKNAQSSLDILTLATENREELKILPADLRNQANEILYAK